MSWKLLAALGGQKVGLKEGITTLRRDPPNYIVLQDSQSSRRHAELENRTDGVFLRDKGFGNGNFLNGQKLVPQTGHPVSDRAEIKIGNTLLSLKLKANPASLPPNPPGALSQTRVPVFKKRY